MFEKLTGAARSCGGDIDLRLYRKSADLRSGRSALFGIIKLFEGLSILLRGGLEGLPLFLMEFLRG